MAQATNIVLADAQATPVDHTFIPLGPLKGWDMVWEDQSQANPVGFWRIYMRLKRPEGRQAGQNIRVDISLQEPVLETLTNNSSGLTPAPTVAFVPRMDLTFAISDRSSLANRKDLRKMGASLLANTHIVAAVENLQSAW